MNLAAPLPAQDQATPVGAWAGEIQSPERSLAIGLQFSADGAGGLMGTVDTPSQYSFGLAWDEVRWDGGELVASNQLADATLRVTLSEAGDTLRGTWDQRGTSTPVECQRQSAPPAVPASLVTGLTGRWEGDLEVGAIKLRIVFFLEPGPVGFLGGYMQSPDQTREKFPVGRVDFAGERQVLVRVGSLSTTFEASLSDTGTVLSGKFKQGPQSFELQLKKVKQATVLKRPQEPKPPFAYDIEEVLYDNKSANLKLAGTLTLPKGPGPFPAAILITGSGPQDRNEEIFEHKPFWVIADHLTQAGIAVLRVDDRGVGGSTTGDDPEAATSFDFATDVSAGMDFLQTHPRIDKEKIGLIGHSEGGTIAPIVTTLRKDVAFAVLLAGVGVRGDKLLVSQNEAIMRASGIDAATIEKTCSVQARLFALAGDASLSSEELKAALTDAIQADEDFRNATPEEQKAGLAQGLAQLMNPWLMTFIRYDPRDVLMAMTCPVLAVNGELDLQVPFEENLAAIGAALKAGQHPDYTIRSFPRLNHLFQHCDKGLVTEYGEIEETFSVEVLDVMTEWIKARM